MKKCPECGNPSYDGAPVCGNCGYKFPKPKVKVTKTKNIFEENEEVIKSSNDESTIEIIKENKVVIATILLITLIVIGIIIATGPSNDTTTQINGSNKYSEAKFSFTYPSDWKEINESDSLHYGAIFFEGSNGTIIEYYNVTSDFTSINEITSQRISYAQANDANINTIQTIQLDGRNASNIIMENYDGNYTRYVSLISDGDLYVFKIDGASLSDVNSDEIESVIQSADIE